MGNYTKLELLLIEKCTIAVDTLICGLIYTQSDKDKLMFSSCLNENEKEVFARKELKKMQKKLAKCNPDIAEFLRCYISPSEIDFTESNYDLYRERLVRNFLMQEFNDVLIILNKKFKNIKEIEEKDYSFWEVLIEESYYGIDFKFIMHFVKYMSIADRLVAFRSILESIDNDNNSIESKTIETQVMSNNSINNNDFKDLLLVEELEKRLAIEAVEYKTKIDELWQTYTFDPTYFDMYISGDLYNVFLNAIYERIKPLNDFEINKYLTLSVNQFKTHTPTKRAETFKRIYQSTYLHPNQMEYKENEHDDKYAMHVWKHYTNHFQLFKEATENALQDFKKGLIGNGRKQEVIEKPKTKTKSKHKSFTYINNITGQTQLTDLMNALKRKNLIDNSTDLKDFRKAFSGEAIDKPITWTGNIINVCK